MCYIDGYAGCYCNINILFWLEKGVVVKTLLRNDDVEMSEWYGFDRTGCISCVVLKINGVGWSHSGYEDTRHLLMIFGKIEKMC